MLSRHSSYESGWGIEMARKAFRTFPMVIRVVALNQRVVARVNVLRGRGVFLHEVAVLAHTEKFRILRLYIQKVLSWTSFLSGECMVIVLPVKGVADCGFCLDHVVELTKVMCKPIQPPSGPESDESRTNTYVIVYDGVLPGLHIFSAQRTEINVEEVWRGHRLLRRCGNIKDPSSLDTRRGKTSRAYFENKCETGVG